MPNFNPLILEKLDEGNRLYGEGKIDEAINISISTLHKLDEIYGDRYKSMEARLIIMSLYKIYFSQGDYIEAQKWAEEVFKCNIPERATSELINLGSVCYELGQYTQAFEFFLKAYKKGKYRAFQEIDPKYWNFFKSKNG